MSNLFLSENRSQYLKSLFPELTDKQFNCLFYYSLGFPSEKIAKIVGCSNKTIRNQIQILKEKLSLHTSSDLRIIFLIRVITPREDHA
ncbi:HTH domain-containing protein [Vibrio parahaemolyticus]|uniref:HTH domain-containing protein n=1 Tax=Vibrio parahaemolyticus TaxID=670 RepID=A0A9Q3UIT2_VIBPH|nr:LuxR C-terminal-related transcriptional regulator [Vibrio parahaemolyticus]MCC3807535.1 HTH domain-containing protein [Vibrio parahaemolyticus]MCI9696503.1 HTH domain-containing protein [Vibrio parahaemolyticus]MCI9711033.1 HTH domain-containing protein [Vibrio parahaemolyticus]MCI9715913.1 HTH domain-containing protein [Vibrio parahaemolyticus]